MNGIKKTQLINAQVLQKMGLVAPMRRAKKPEGTATAENEKASRQTPARESDASQGGNKSGEKADEAGAQ